MSFAVSLKQTHVDKSRVSLRTRSFIIYPLHITLLNFKEVVRRRHISQGHTIKAYLSAFFGTCFETDETREIAASLYFQT